MENLPVIVCIALAVLGALLAGFAAAGFAALIEGCFEVRRGLRATSYNFDSVLLKSPIVPGVSVVYVPPDASPESLARTRRFLDLHFGRHEVVLVLNAPAPQELDRWTREFHLSRQESAAKEDLHSAAIRGCYVSSDPIRLLVVETQPCGLADALNAGVNAAQYPVIALADGEAEFIAELLLRMIRPMLADWDHTVAVCGVAPPPPAHGLAGRIGALESLRLWLARCGALSSWNRLLPVPGACMLVKREAVRSVGGFRGGPLGLFLELHAAGSADGSRRRVAFLAAPASVRPAAASWDDLRRHARADQRQLGVALGRLGPGMGAGREFLGLFCIRGLRPLLETAALVLAVAGWVAGAVPTALAALVLVIAIGPGIVNSMAAVVLRELAEPSGMAPGRLAALFLTAIPENFGYRQIRNLWLIAGFFGAPRSPKQNRGRTVPDGAPASETPRQQ